MISTYCEDAFLLNINAEAIVAMDNASVSRVFLHERRYETACPEKEESPE